MLSDIKNIVKNYRNDIILISIVILISLLSFAIGYIIAKHQEKEPIRVEDISHIQLYLVESHNDLFPLLT